VDDVSSPTARGPVTVSFAGFAPVKQWWTTSHSAPHRDLSVGMAASPSRRVGRATDHVGLCAMIVAVALLAAVCDAKKCVRLLTAVCPKLRL
jgi:hypothetical protein